MYYHSPEHGGHPGAVVGSYLWDYVSLEIAFTVAFVIGLVGTGHNVDR